MATAAPGCTARELQTVIEARASGLPGALVCVVAAHAAYAHIATMRRPKL